MVPLIGAKDIFLIQKKYYGFAFKAFLRSKAALKIPVRKKIFFFKNFHCLWCPNMYLGGIWWYHFRFGPTTKNVKNAIFQIWTFWPKNWKQCFLQISSLEFTTNSEHYGHLNFSNTLRNDWFTLISGEKSKISKSIIS